MNNSTEQQQAFNAYREGKNIFITGPGGTGKSTLIRQIYQDAKMRGKNISVTALTGCAAILLECNAKTLHSWCGIGLGNAPIGDILRKLKNSRAKNKWKTADILVVDEVSMMSLKMFELIDSIGRSIRKCPTKPFGGIQVIFSGDFFQLPPIGSRNDPDSQKFCFESKEWPIVFPQINQIILKHIFRQKDEIYCKILNQIRCGILTKSSLNHLLACVNKPRPPNMLIEPTRLYPLRSSVEQINQQRMATLDGEEHSFLLDYKVEIPSPFASTVDNKNIITGPDIKTVTLKTPAIIKTSLNGNKDKDEQTVSYSREDIQRELEFLANNLLCDLEVVLKKGSQVMCIINIPKTIMNGHGHGHGQEDEGLLVCNGSQGIIKDFCKITGNPIVTFNNGITLTMEKNIWLSDKIPGVGVAQIPLILAWAITIHKSQGATLDVAEIDAGRAIFECGQTYVALSRVKSLEGLYLTAFDPLCIKVNKQVQDFYKQS